MDKKQLFNSVIVELYAHISYLEYGEGYEDNAAHKAGLKRAEENRQYIKELKALVKEIDGETNVTG